MTVPVLPPPPPASATAPRSTVVAVAGVAGGVGVSSIAAALRDRLDGVTVWDVGPCAGCRPDLSTALVVAVTRPGQLEAVEALDPVAVVVSEVTPRRMSRADAWAVRASDALVLPYADGGRPLESRPWLRAVDRLAVMLDH